MRDNAELPYDRLLRLVAAAGLPGVELSTSYRMPALKVGGKAFTGWRGETIVPFMLPDLKDMLLAVSPEIYFETDHYKGSTWVLVRLDVISDEELTQRLIDAWRARASKALRGLYPSA